MPWRKVLPHKQGEFFFAHRIKGGTGEAGMAVFFSDLLDSIVSPGFLKRVCDKFHYGEMQLAELQAVAEALLPLMRREAFWERKVSFIGREVCASGKMKDSDTDYEDVVMTLGAGVDCLQDSYCQKGMLSEGYMIEALAGELLLEGYRAYNRKVEEGAPWHVVRYHFPGSRKELPLELLPGLLEGFPPQISCNGAFCVMPKKSVIFIAELTRNGQIRCEGICAGCGNVHCPNRMADSLQMGRRTADLSLNYGYGRIFGKQ